MKCSECGGRLIPTTTNHKLDSIPPIEIKYLEAYVCTQCGEVYLTRSALKKIESIEAKLHESSEVTWEDIRV